MSASDSKAEQRYPAIEARLKEIYDEPTAKFMLARLNGQTEFLESEFPAVLRYKDGTPLWIYGTELPVSHASPESDSAP